MKRMQSASAEIEAKLIVGDGFEMPDLNGVLAGAIAVSQPVRELDAVYFDTVNLELARWGITLRHRAGESGRPWTLKLPQHTDRVVLARQELRFEGTVERVPDPAIDLVRAFTLGRPLVEVARLRTKRIPVLVSDRQQRPLVEIVDDTVAVSSSDGVITSRFREVEIEATNDSPNSLAALNEAVARVIDAGGQPEPPLPKLVRALGAKATGPPPVVVDHVGARSSSGDLIRHLVATSVVQILVNDPGVRLGQDPEALHRYRVAVRRLRSDLRTFRSALDHAPTDAVRAELRWLGSVVGPVRDHDVLGARIADHARSLADQDQPGAAAVHSRLATERANALTAVIDALNSERYIRLLETLVGFASHPPLSATSRRPNRPAATRAGNLVKRRWKQLDAAVDNAGKDPSDDELHRIRIAAKRCRYAAEAVAPVVGRPAHRFARRVEKVQGVLGDYHDTVVAEAWLRSAAVELPDARLAIGGLIAIEHGERARLRTEWPATWQSAANPKARDWF